jgi:hypothetical protein
MNEANDTPQVDVGESAVGQVECDCHTWFPGREIHPMVPDMAEIVGYDIVDCPNCSKQWYVKEYNFHEEMLKQICAAMGVPPKYFR